MIPKYTLDTHPATHENICDVCDMVESAHEKYITSRRPQDHVYKPRCTTNHTVSIGTFSWEPLEPHTDIREFVRSVCNKKDNYSVWANAIDFFEKLIHEVENTVQDSDLPVLDMTCKKFGIVNSFRFVFFFTRVYPSDCIALSGLHCIEWTALHCMQLAVHCMRGLQCIACQLAVHCMPTCGALHANLLIECNVCIFAFCNNYKPRLIINHAF